MLKISNYQIHWCNSILNSLDLSWTTGLFKICLKWFLFSSFISRATKYFHLFYRFCLFFMQVFLTFLRRIFFFWGEHVFSKKSLIFKYLNKPTHSKWIVIFVFFWNFSELLVWLISGLVVCPIVSTLNLNLLVPIEKCSVGKLVYSTRPVLCFYVHIKASSPLAEQDTLLFLLSSERNRI